MIKKEIKKIDMLLETFKKIFILDDDSKSSIVHYHDVYNVFCLRILRPIHSDIFVYFRRC